MTTTAPTSTVQSAAEFLVAEGWREYPSLFRKYARCFYKSHNTKTRCSHNSDKPGIQIEIAVSKITHPDTGDTFEMELSAGLPDDTWLTIHNYSLPHDIKAVVALIPRMLAVWESANCETQCTCGEPHTSQRIEHRYDGTNCRVKDFYKDEPS